MNKYSNIMIFRKNQYKAIEYSISNNFSSGVHFHATGTGKSWIALQLILEYNKMYKKNNVLWLCEKKTILLQQFKREIIKDKGFEDIFNTFLIINYTENKPNDWYSKVNSSTFWNKPILLIINRSFLVSQKKYEKLKIKLDLIIHDECHTIENNTTREFYNYITNLNKSISCLGFSATPCLEYNPFKNVITSYTIYDAFCDNVIVAPKIKWISTTNSLTDLDYLEISRYNIQTLPYKKILVWCGIIEKCYELSYLWKEHMRDMDIFIDTSKDDDSEFEIYSKLEGNAVLFCAGKHREGSDIYNLDCCIFLDKVKNRNAKTFVQCIGRVLRKDKNNNKKNGLIIDFKASSCIKVCDRMNDYLNCKGFPWDYTYKSKNINTKKYIEHTLILKKKDIVLALPETYNIIDIQNKFIRNCINNPIYHNRLKMELNMIESKKLENYLMRAVNILEMIDYIPHVTRGSCGSSLVCYLLGISNVDPVKQNISFSRFLNEYRDTLPDIDFDFPHILRDEVFLKLELNWPNQVARISNHVYWHEKSALREALRRIGINKMIPKENLYSFIKTLSPDKQFKIKKIQKEIENTFRHYSLHCGGIIFFNDGVPDDLILNKKILSQIVFNKKDVSKNNNFKIDILSSRAITQILDIRGNVIDFDNCPYDEKTYNLLQSGNNIGITLAESPLMRKALLTIKPKSIDDIALCLAIIRPAAKDTRLENNTIDYSTKFVYDDDIIHLLSCKLKITEALADKFRRCLSKHKWKKKDLLLYSSLFSRLNSSDKQKIKKYLENLQYYSFCKSHSYSYAQLVYKLAYEKAHNPKQFWKSTLKNASSAYRKWVHIYEAFRHGITINNIKSNEYSIYAEHKSKKGMKELSVYNQIIQFGYWDMEKYSFYPNCYFYKKNTEYLFSGLIASIKIIQKCNLVICFICVSPGKYIEVSLKNSYIKKNSIGLKGRAIIKNEREQIYSAHISKFY